ncbi:MAG: Flp family type IVb pilin [Pseudomonadota bacterium]
MADRSKRALQCLPKDRRGATAVEYGLIVSLLVVALIAAFSATEQSWNKVSDEVATTMNDAAN